MKGVSACLAHWGSVLCGCDKEQNQWVCNYFIYTAQNWWEEPPPTKFHFTQSSSMNKLNLTLL